MDRNIRSRKWLLTFNNPLEHNYSHETLKDILPLFKSCSYWCMCDEIGGKTQTYHTHLFIYSANQIRFQTLKNRFPGAHIDMCRGTPQDNRDYIRKEGKYKDTDKAETNLKETFEEMGQVPIEHQGKRNDLNRLYDWIKEGMTNFEILEENPEYMTQLDKIERCRQIIKQEEFKNTFRTLQVEYYYGKTGTGKTRGIMERYGYENVYRVTDYQHPWDSYRSQDVIIFEEFYSSNFRISEMLNYLDGYPLDLPCRYNNKQACYTKVFIISNIPLEEQYRDIKREHVETWKAFLRRIHAVKVYDDAEHIREFYCIDDYLKRWEPITEREIKQVFAYANK
ncbi:MAG: replication protein [Lachnospiraceae bacterium]|nr:replication protein [Lachnospiraceae bacterium]